jgi:hypothetical protein
MATTLAINNAQARHFTGSSPAYKNDARPKTTIARRSKVKVGHFPMESAGLMNNRSGGFT